MNNQQFPNRPGGIPPVPPMSPMPAEGMATASMILGIVSLVGALGFFWIPIAPQVIAIVGIILGASAKRQGNTGSAATAGIVMSVIALALGIALLIGSIACLACACALIPFSW